jgi:YD repeat-containing protein
MTDENKAVAHAFRHQAIRLLQQVARRNVSLRPRLFALMGSFYAHYLLWTLGRPKHFLLQVVFWLFSAWQAYASLRLWELWIRKLVGALQYLIDKQACLEVGRRWLYLPNMGREACSACGDWLEVYTPDVFTLEGCLQGLFAYPRAPEILLARLQGVERWPAFATLDFSEQDWLGWRRDQFQVILQALTNVPRPLTCLNLSRPFPNLYGVDPGKVQDLVDFLHKMPVQRLDLHNVGLDVATVQLIASIQNNTLSYLDISGNQLSDETFSALVSAILPHPIEALQLGDNRLGDESLRVLSARMGNTTWTAINLRANQFGAAGMDAFFQQLPLSLLQRVDFSQNELSEANFTRFWEATISARGFNEFICRQCALGNDYWLASLSYLQKTKITQLDLRANLFTDQGIILFFQSLRGTQTIVAIDLGNNPLGEESLEAISLALPQTPLHTLGLGDNQFSVPGLTRLLEAILESGVESINLAGNSLKDEGAFSLANALSPFNRSWARWDLSNNGITEAGGKALMQGFARHRIRHLVLANNQLGSMTLQRLVMHRGSGLERLDMAYNQVDSQGLDLLAAYLPQSSIEMLDLSHNNLRDSGAVRLGQVLIDVPEKDKLSDPSLSLDQQRALYLAKPTTPLRELKLSNNHLTGESARVLCRVLPGSQLPIAALDLTGNPIDPGEVNLENCQVSGGQALRPAWIYPYLVDGWQRLKGRLWPAMSDKEKPSSITTRSEKGELLEEGTFGQAKVQVYANVSNGNCVIIDRLLQLVDQNGILSLGYVYNSQAPSVATKWRLYHKRLCQPDQNASTLVMEEADGHLTTYTIASARMYVAEGLSDGTPVCRFNSLLGLWQWFHPGLGILEFYDSRGLLQSRQDTAGRKTQFIYDTYQALSEVHLPSGTLVSIQRTTTPSGLQVEFVVKPPDQALGTVLQTHQFSSNGLLERTQTPQGYCINYQADPLRGWMAQISQTDGMALNFVFDTNPYSAGYISRVQLTGMNFKITYPPPPFSESSYVSLIDPVQSETRFYLDKQGRIVKLLQQAGFEPSFKQHPDVTTYEYTPAGQVKCITRPDGGNTTWEYDPAWGVITQKTLANGQSTQYYYFGDAGGNVPCRLISQVASDPVDGRTSITYFVYDPQFKGDYCFLRFKVSPEGRVTEYRPDAQGNVASQRVYRSARFVTQQKPPAPVSVKVLEDWAKTVPQNEVALTTYQHNARGQVSEERLFTAVDSQGNGIENASMGVETTEWDYFGQCLKRIVKQDDKASQVTQQTFDDLERLTQQVDPLQATTKVTYLDAACTHTTTYANQREETLIYQPGSGRLIERKETAWCETYLEALGAHNKGVRQERLTTYQCDALGQAIITQAPDGQLTYTFFDYQHRLGFKVSPVGSTLQPTSRVTETVTNRQQRYNLVRVYHQSINPEDLYLVYPPPIPGVLPNADKLRKTLLPAIADKARDRLHYQFLDASSRVIWEVDVVDGGYGYGIETRYDTLDRVTATVAYGERITLAQLEQLLNGQLLVLPFDPRKDRCTRFFYDRDGFKVGQQVGAGVDGKGYVTEFVRDGKGDIVMEKRYATPVPLDLTVLAFEAVKPPANPLQDAITTFILDARGQCVQQIDAEGYVVAAQYQASGQVKQQTRYATRSEGWLARLSNVSLRTRLPAAPPLPPASLEDETTTFEYDALEREISRTGGPLNAQVQKTYDLMANPLSTVTLDGLALDAIEPDTRRAERSRYNGWDQVIAKANAFVSQEMDQIAADPHLSPEEKHQQIETLWATQTTRLVYDATGLLLRTIDGLGYITRYYYDKGRRPVLTINPEGAAILHIVNAWAEVETTRAYSTRISAESLVTLTGGLLDDKVLSLLKESPLDQVTQYVRDQRGHITLTSDPEGYTTLDSFNAFGELEQHLAVLDKLASSMIKVTTDYETRGLAVAITRESQDKTLRQTTGAAYDNLYGKRTVYRDAQGNTTETTYDRLGQRYTEINALGVLTCIETCDAFGRVVEAQDALGNVTKTIYQQALRLQSVHYPVAGTQKIIQTNVFGEVIAITNGLGEVEYFQHAPDGQITTYQDALGYSTLNRYDRLGQKRYYLDARQILTQWDYNGMGQVERKVEDVGGLNLSTRTTRDAFGNAIMIEDPRNVVTQNRFDRRNLLQSSCQDPTVEGHVGLDLLTTYVVNGQEEEIQKSQGTLAVPAQYVEAYTHDGLGRDSGKVIDPGGFTLTTRVKRDLNGNRIAETDANGYTKRWFYDALKRERFHVDGEGGVYEQGYDVGNQLILERAYVNRVDPTQLSDGTTLAAFMLLLKLDERDALSLYFYDANGKRRFTVNSLGEVLEEGYNAAERLCHTVPYATRLDPALLPTLTTKACEAWALAHQTPQDSHTYTVFDAKGQPCLTLDAEAYAKERRFDPNGNEIASITYSKQLTQPDQVAKLPLAQALAHLTPTVLEDIANYKGLDSQNRLSFEVDGEGGVTRYGRDENGNLTQTIHVKEVINVPSDYSALVTAVQALVVNPKVDAITESVFDCANRKRIDRDAAGYEDHFELDALGHITAHQDRGGQTWRNQYDSAGRLFEEITPPLPITTITTTSLDQRLTLVRQQSTQAVKKRYISDNLGNPLIRLEGTNLPEGSTLDALAKADLSDVRIICATYDGCRRLVKTEVLGVAIDDPLALASFQVRPEQSVNLSTETVYDAKGHPVALCDEAGVWTFQVYDAQNRLVYEIASDGAVKEKTYDALGNLISETAYFVPLSLDLSLYRATGIPHSVVKANLQPHAEDRHESYQRDRRGDIVLRQQGPVWYYLPQGEMPQQGIAFRQTVQRWDAFKRCRQKRVLVDPVQNAWADSFSWFDRCNQVLAECDEVQAVKRYTRNSRGDELTCLEWANPLAKVPTIDMTLAQLDLLHVPSRKDRLLQTEYDTRRLVISETRTSIDVQTLTIDPTTKQPSFQDEPPRDLTRSYAYSALERQILVVDEAGASAYKFYDPRGNVLATTGVPRESTAPDGTPVTWVPLTLTGYNAFGQSVAATRFKQGTRPVDPLKLDILPVPLNPDPEDQTTLTLLDARGLSIWKQDAVESVQGLTYTATRELAREWMWVTLATSASVRLTAALDEKQYRYDSKKNCTQIQILRNHQIQETTSFKPDVFNQVTHEGDEKQQPLVHCYDTLGQCWKTNAEKGVFTVYGYDLSGHESVRLQSSAPIEDNAHSLELITYAQVASVLTWPEAVLERVETIRDYRGRVIGKVTQGSSNMVDTGPLNIPLDMVVGNTFPGLGLPSLSFTYPQETNVTPAFLVWPIDDKTKAQVLPIVLQGGRGGIDLSSLVTDVYAYEINYYLADTRPYRLQGATLPVASVPMAPDSPLLYRTSGSFQVVTANSTLSQRLVVQVEAGGQVALTGNTQNLTGLALYQGDTLIAQVPVEPNEAGYQADLSLYPTGIYTVKPILSTGQEAPMSLPFRITTVVDTALPTSRELPCKVQFRYLASHGQVIWTVPSEAKTFSVQFTCQYQAVDGTAQTHTDTIAPGHVIAEYPDDKGTILYCNTEFEQDIASITTISVALVLDAVNQIPLMQELTPQASHLGASRSAVTSANPSPARLTAQSHLLGAQDDITADWEWVLASTTSTHLSPDRLETSWVDVGDVTCVAEAPIISPHLQVASSPTADKRFGSLLTDRAPHLFASAGLIQTVDFPSTLTLAIGPLALEGTSPTSLAYFDTSIDRLADWKQLAITAVLAPEETGIFKPGIVVDVTGLMPGYYPFRLGTQIGQWVVSNGAMIYPSMLPKYQATEPPLPTIATRYQYDVWDNRTAVTDPLGHTTTFDYNKANAILLETKPETVVVKEDGSEVHLKPQTAYGYNVLGTPIGIRQPNQATQGFINDAAGQVRREIWADGSTTTYLWDALARKVGTLDPRGLLWQSGYDRRNHVCTFTTPQNNTHTFLWDQKQQRIAHLLPGGRAYRQQMDAMGNLEALFYPSGRGYYFTHDRNHQVLGRSSSDGDSLRWERDWFGNALQFTDLGGSICSYTHNQAGLLTGEISQGGNHGQTLQLLTYQMPYGMARERKIFFSPDMPFRSDAVVPVTHLLPMSTPPKWVKYHYRHKWLLEIEDRGTQQRVSYDLDWAGRRTGVLVRSLLDDSVLRQASTGYDPLGHETHLYDTEMTVDIGYDEMGNRRYISAVYYPGSDGTQPPLVQSKWFAYNPTNTVRINGGILQSGVIRIAPGQGIEVGYAQGLRVFEQQILPDNTVLQGSLIYDNENQIRQILTSQGVVTQRTLDPAGWLLQTMERGPRTAILHDMQYDLDGFMGWSRLLQDGQLKVVTTLGNPRIEGLPRTQHSELYDTHQALSAIDDLQCDYVGFGGSWQLSGIGGTRTTPDGKGAYAYSQRFFNANGLVNGQFSAGGQHRYFVTTPDGLVLSSASSRQFSAGGLGPPIPFQFSAESYSGDMVTQRFFHTANGQPMASYLRGPRQWNQLLPGWQMIEINLDYFQAVSRTHPLVSPADLHPEVNAGIDRQIQDIIKNNANKGRKQVSQADTDHIYALSASKLPDIQAYSLEQFDDSYPPHSPFMYIPAAGDTFESIAQSQKGNACYAAEIAAVNGWSVSDTPFPGEPLFIPPSLSNYNQFNTYLPSEQFLNLLYGSLSPHLPEVSHHPRLKLGHGGWWHKFGGLIGAITLAITCLVAPPLAAGVAAALGVAAGSLAAAAIEALVTAFIAGLTNAAIQKLAVASGLKAHFSWQEVGLMSLNAGLTAGLGLSANPATNLTLDYISKQLAVFITMGFAEQLANMDAGLQHGFDLGALLSNVGLQLTNLLVNMKLANYTNFSQSYAGRLGQTAIRGFTGGFTHASWDHLINGRVFRLETIAADSLNTLVDQAAFDLTTTAVRAVETTTERFFTQESVAVHSRQAIQRQGIFATKGRAPGTSQGETTAANRYGKGGSSDYEAETSADDGNSVSRQRVGASASERHPAADMHRPSVPRLSKLTPDATNDNDTLADWLFPDWAEAVSWSEVDSNGNVPSKASTFWEGAKRGYHNPLALVDSVPPRLSNPGAYYLGEAIGALGFGAQFLPVGRVVRVGLSVARLLGKFGELWKETKLIERQLIFGGRGAISGRVFDETAAGGPLRNLAGTQSRIRFTHRGIDVVEAHTSRFGFDVANQYMIERLRAIADGKISATQIDRNFYSHELREFVRYRRLGWGVGVPPIEEVAQTLWNNTHTATLEEYGISNVDLELYYPQALQLAKEQLQQEFSNLLKFDSKF